MQTIERPTSRPPRRPPWAGILAVLAAAASVPLLLLASQSTLGSVIAVGLALLIGLGIWVWYRGFVFVEIVAFLIHFDGLGAGPVRMGRIVAAIAAVVIIAKLIKGWVPPAMPVRHWAPVWAMLVWAVCSGLWSQEIGAWFYAFGVFGLGLAYFCITGLLVDTHRMVQQFLRAYWVGGLFGSAGGIIAFIIGTRAVGFGSDPNFFGLITASMIPLTVYYRRNAPTREAKWAYTIALLPILVAAAGAGSRSGLIGGALAIVGTMVTRPGLRPGRRVVVGIGSLFVGALAFVVGFLANPINLQRGFSDRGAGRVDLWTVAGALIRERPILGYGFGQIKLLIPPNLLLTPGSQRLNELRPDVSPHNTWLDTVGDLGLVGLLLFATVFAVAIAGFLRPRWLETRQLSTTLFVMMLPVLSGSFFLPLTNNKVAWALLGLSAALAVPSNDSRWSGVMGALRAGPGHREPSQELEPVRPLLPAPRPKGERPEVPGEEVFEPVPLARWDLRLTRRDSLRILLAGMVAALVCFTAGSLQPTTYTASAGVLVPRVDGSAGTDVVRFERERLQGALTLGVSGAFAQVLARNAELDLSVDEVRDRLDATRPRMGLYVEISYTDTDRANVEAVMPQLIASLDEVFEGAQEFSFEETEDALRPLVPGESRVYTGPAYLHAFEEGGFAVNPPRATWFGFVGFVAGALAALGWVLAGQRRPRLNATDDLRRHLGLAVWAHVGGRSRRRPTRDQYAQVLATSRSVADGATTARRFVVATPDREPLARRLVLGLAVELAAQGTRTVLVDADVRRPWLTARLGGFGRRGLVDVASGTELVHVVRRIRRWRLPRLERRILGGRGDALRFVPAGRFRRHDAGGDVVAALEQVDPEVAVIVLAPPTLGDRAVSDLFGWADVLLLGSTVGRTVTHDMEDAAAQITSFTVAPAGVVLLDG